MSSHNEIEIEAVPGLPEDLPRGESLLWQGRPDWWALAQQSFKIRWIAAYFAVFIAVTIISAIQAGEGARGVLHVAAVCGLAFACLGGLTFVAWLYARATVYSITTRRVVLRIGVAVPVTWNIPFKRIATADMLARDAGDGDITLQLAGSDRIAWLHLWPHVQPWHYVKARPSLRAIPDPKAVAEILGRAVEAWSSSVPARPPLSASSTIGRAPALAPEAVH